VLKKPLTIKLFFTLSMLVILRISLVMGGEFLHCCSIDEISLSNSHDENDPVSPIVLGIKVLYNERDEESSEKMSDLDTALMGMATLLRSGNMQNQDAMVNLANKTVTYFNQEKKHNFEMERVTLGCPAYCMKLIRTKSEIIFRELYELPKSDKVLEHKGFYHLPFNVDECTQYENEKLLNRIRKQLYALCGPAQNKQNKVQNTMPYSEDIDGNDLSALCIPCKIQCHDFFASRECRYYSVFIFQNNSSFNNGYSGDLNSDDCEIDGGSHGRKNSMKRSDKRRSSSRKNKPHEKIREQAEEQRVVVNKPEAGGAEGGKEIDTTGSISCSVSEEEQGVEVLVEQNKPEVGGAEGGKEIDTTGSISCSVSEEEQGVEVLAEQSYGDSLEQPPSIKKTAEDNTFIPLLTKRLEQEEEQITGIKKSEIYEGEGLDKNSTISVTIGDGNKEVEIFEGQDCGYSLKQPPVEVIEHSGNNFSIKCLECGKTAKGFTLYVAMTVFIVDHMHPENAKCLVDEFGLFYAHIIYYFCKNHCSSYITVLEGILLNSITINDAVQNNFSVTKSIIGDVINNLVSTTFVKVFSKNNPREILLSQGIQESTDVLDVNVIAVPSDEAGVVSVPLDREYAQVSVQNESGSISTVIVDTDGTSMHDMYRSDAQHSYFINKENRSWSYNNVVLNSRIKLDILVNGGLFYGRAPNVVCCFFCGVNFNSVHNEDELWSEHALKSPDCSFLKNNKSIEFIEKAKNKHHEFSHYEERIRSYSTWPCTNTPGKELLAGAGFFYTGQGDCVVCFCCGIELVDWKADDIPWESHAAFSSKCRFLQECKYTNFINRYGIMHPEFANKNARITSYLNAKIVDLADKAKPLADAGFFYNKVNNVIRCFYCDVSIDGSSDQDPWLKHAIANATCHFLISNKSIEFTHCTKAKSMEFLNPAIRENSYLHWPKESIQPARRLSEAGFFFTQTTDAVSCFNCNLTLTNLKEIHDPWALHATYSSCCSFLRCKKDMQFINHYQAAHPHFRDIKERLDTYNYAKFKCNFNRDDFVNAGFFSLGKDDLVSCFQCGLTIRNWNANSNPVKEHIRHGAECVYLATIVGQEVITQVITEWEKTYKPAQPGYRTLSARQNSFSSSSLSAEIKQYSYDIAAAGFYYRGENNVHCHHCAGGLTLFKPQCNLWIEHAKFFPDCKFLIKYKGKEFVELHSRKTEVNNSYGERSEAAEAEADSDSEVVSSQLPKECYQMEVIEKAINSNDITEEQGAHSIQLNHGDELKVDDEEEIGGQLEKGMEQLDILATIPRSWCECGVL